MIRVKSGIVTFFVAFAVWMVLSWEAGVASIAAGMLISALVSLATSHLFTGNHGKWAQPKRYFYFLIYILIFLRECVKANIDVAMRVIRPSLPINPGIVKVRTRLKSEAALTFLANSITLTPGTLSVDLDPATGVIYVHWIDVKDTDMVKATNIIVKRFEQVIEKVFE